MQSSTLKLRVQVATSTEAALTGGSGTAPSTEQTNISGTMALTATRVPRPGRDSTKPNKRALSIAIRYTNLADPGILVDSKHDEADLLVEFLISMFAPITSGFRTRLTIVVAVCSQVWVCGREYNSFEGL